MGLCDEFRHTQAPWKSIGGGVYQDFLRGAYEQAAAGKEIVWGNHMSRSSTPQEKQANANLIAAAPDMLAALCDWYDAMNEGFDSVRGRALYAATEEAIGKAQYGYDIDKNNIRQTLLSGSGKRIFKDKE